MLLHFHETFLNYTNYDSGEIENKFVITVVHENRNLGYDSLFLMVKQRAAAKGGGL